jgi:hypothetical protein
MRVADLDDGFEFEIQLQTEQIEIDPLYMLDDRHRPMLTETTPRRNADDILFDQLLQNADEENDCLDDLMHQESLLD